MKTIEEINEISPYKANEWQEGYGIWQHGYMQGQKDAATEQKKIDIDKACDLLHDLLIEEDEAYLGNAGILKAKIEKFHKAMEE